MGSNQESLAKGKEGKTGGRDQPAQTWEECIHPGRGPEGWSQRLEHVDANNETADEAWATFRDTLLDTIKNTCGTSNWCTWSGQENLMLLL